MLKKLDDVLKLFSTEQRELEASQIVDLLGRPASTVYRQLRGLESVGFLDRDAEGRYRLGIRLTALGELARQSTSLQRAAHQWLRRLTDETGETVDLSVLQDGRAITIDVAESPRPLMIPGLLGGQVPLHATAAGKALLAWRSEEEVREILSAPLERFTERTITDVSALLRDLEAARERGFTLVNGEWYEHVLAVGAPIRDHRNRVFAALAVGGPRIRLDENALEEGLALLVTQAADEVSRALAWNPDMVEKPANTVTLLTDRSDAEED